MSILQFIGRQYTYHSIKYLCQMLGVVSSRYYAWRLAQAESPWSRLKTEDLEARDRPVFTDLADAQASVAAYFDYNHHERRHSSIGYQKPYQFHQQQLNNITQFSPA